MFLKYFYLFRKLMKIMLLFINSHCNYYLSMTLGLNDKETHAYTEGSVTHSFIHLLIHLTNLYRSFIIYGNDITYRNT